MGDTFLYPNWNHGYFYLIKFTFVRPSKAIGSGRIVQWVSPFRGTATRWKVRWGVCGGWPTWCYLPPHNGWIVTLKGPSVTVLEGPPSPQSRRGTPCPIPGPDKPPARDPMSTRLSFTWSVTWWYYVGGGRCILLLHVYRLVGWGVHAGPLSPSTPECYVSPIHAGILHACPHWVHLTRTRVPCLLCPISVDMYVDRVVGWYDWIWYMLVPGMHVWIHGQYIHAPWHAWHVYEIVWTLFGIGNEHLQCVW